MRTTKRFLIFACAVAVCTATGGVVASPATQAAGTYVALGDSVATPSDSYVYVLFQFLRTPEGGGLDTLYNRASGGEDSTTLRSNGQLATAIADIDGPSDTKVVTIDIGGNDRFLCGGSSPSWHLSSCPFAANFDATLADLQAALGRDPGSESLIAMTYYNPASGLGSAQEQEYDRGLLGADLRIYCAPSGDPRLGLNDRIICISRSRGALVADVYPAFKLGGQALMGDSIHPNSQGQAVIAAEFRKALGKPSPAPTPSPAPNPAATAGNDWLTGTPGDDLLCGLAGSDVIFGLAGNDTLFGDACGDKALAGHAVLASAVDGNDSLFGGAGDDRLYGAGGRDALRGDGGKDFLSGGSGSDKLRGESGRDRLLGGGGRDRLIGGSSRDRLDAGTGNDRIAGNSGNDVLRAGKGRDRIWGGSGNDRIVTRDGRRDRVDCGRGKKDRVRADRADRLRRCEVRR
jgi:Ca2+-binding RTX toxin-like protein